LGLGFTGALGTTLGGALVVVVVVVVVVVAPSRSCKSSSLKSAQNTDLVEPRASFMRDSRLENTKCTLLILKKHVGPRFPLVQTPKTILSWFKGVVVLHFLPLNMPYSIITE